MNNKPDEDNFSKIMSGFDGECLAGALLYLMPDSANVEMQIATSNDMDDIRALDNHPRAGKTHAERRDFLLYKITLAARKNRNIQINSTQKGDDFLEMMSGDPGQCLAAVLIFITPHSIAAHTMIFSRLDRIGILDWRPALGKTQAERQGFALNKIIQAVNKVRDRDRDTDKDTDTDRDTDT